MAYINIISSPSIDNIQLGDSHLGNSRRGKRSQRAGVCGSLARGKMRLRSDTIDGDAGCEPGLDVGDHSGGEFSVGGGIETVGGLLVHCL
jgi:hypothetical protein